jgi:hypothetical protein
VDPERYKQRYGGEYTVRTRRKYSYVAGWHTDVTAAWCSGGTHFSPRPR